MNSFSIDIPRIEEMFNLMVSMQETITCMYEKLNCDNNKLSSIEDKINSIQNTKLLNIVEAAKYMGRSKSSVCRYMKSGLITPLYTGENGNAPKFLREELDNVIRFFGDKKRITLKDINEYERTK